MLVEVVHSVLRSTGGALMFERPSYEVANRAGSSHLKLQLGGAEPIYLSQKLRSLASRLLKEL